MYAGPLYICADHGGYQLKRRLVRYIQNELQRDVIDLGAHTYNELDDFPDYVIPAAIKAVANNGRLIATCGSGAGEVIAANRVLGMRMTIGYNIDAARLAVEHNNANGLALAGRVLSDDHAMAIVKTYLETEHFLGGKYQRRMEKIDTYVHEGIIPTPPESLAEKQKEEV